MQLQGAGYFLMFYGGIEVDKHSENLLPTQHVLIIFVRWMQSNVKIDGDEIKCNHMQSI